MNKIQTKNKCEIKIQYNKNKNKQQKITKNNITNKNKINKIIIK